MEGEERLGQMEIRSLITAAAYLGVETSPLKVMYSLFFGGNDASG